MKILVSPVSKDEALLLANSEVDIIDIKNVNEGSLGAQIPKITDGIVKAVLPYNKETSATLGDLPDKPGTAALAALGLASCGVNYIKAGLYGSQTYSQALNMLNAIVDTVLFYRLNVKIVASCYADWRKFGGLSPFDLISAGAKANVFAVMVDTAIKDGSTLFDVMSIDEIRVFVSNAKKNNLQVALAGSINEKHFPQIIDISPDIIGVRGAVCEGMNRNLGITKSSIDIFFSAYNNVKNGKKNT